MKWRGGAQMPGRFGPVWAEGFCVLEQVGSTLTLEMWPRWLLPWFGYRGRVQVSANEALIFPVSRRKWRLNFGGQGIGLLHKSIGVQPERGGVCYFYPSSWDVNEILMALQQAGFNVSRQERPFEERSLF
jgi:hypothetical protein